MVTRITTLTKVGTFGKESLGCLPLRWQGLMHPCQHVPHIAQRVMGLQLYGSGCSAWTPDGEGVQEPSHQPPTPHHHPLLNNQAEEGKDLHLLNR